MEPRPSERQRRSAQFVTGTSFDEPAPHAQRKSRNTIITPVPIASTTVAEEREAYIRRLSTTTPAPAASERKRSILLSKYLRQGSKPIIWTTTEDSLMKALEIPVSYESNLRTQTVDEESSESSHSESHESEVHVPMTVVRDALVTLSRHDERFKDPTKLQRVLSAKAIARHKAAMKASVARLRKGTQMSSPTMRSLPAVSRPSSPEPPSPKPISINITASDIHEPLVIQLSPTKHFNPVLNTSPCFSTMTRSARVEVENTLCKNAITLQPAPQHASAAGTKLVYLPLEATCKRWLIDRIEPTLELEKEIQPAEKAQETIPTLSRIPVPVGKPRVFRPNKRLV